MDMSWEGGKQRTLRQCRCWRRRRGRDTKRKDRQLAWRGRGARHTKRENARRLAWKNTCIRNDWQHTRRSAMDRHDDKPRTVWTVRRRPPLVFQSPADHTVHRFDGSHEVLQLCTPESHFPFCILFYGFDFLILRYYLSRSIYSSISIYRVIFNMCNMHT